MDKKNIPLQLEKRENILNGKIMMESVNIDILKKLINSSDEDGLLLSYEKITNEDIYTNEFTKKIYCTEREQLKKYLEKIKFRFAFVKYEKTRKLENFGRVFPALSLSLFSFRKQIRGALAYGLYVDIDIQNAHPSILLQICKDNNIECKYLEKYVNNRDKYIETVMKFYDIKRETAKELFIILLYFGSFRKWAEINKIEKEQIKLIANFKNELRNIGKEITKNNKHLMEIIENKCILIKKCKKNIIGSTISTLLCEWEYRIIEQIYIYCTNNKIINNDAVICADGLMIKHDKYYDGLLIEFQELIKNKLGFNLKFVKKDLNTEILDKI